MPPPRKTSWRLFFIGDRSRLLMALIGSISGSALFAADGAAPSWTTLFAFGDSYSDSGAGYVDGDGPTAIVYAAEVLGIPFTHANDPEGGGQGLNYAVSGARTGEGDGRRIQGALLGYGMHNQVNDFVVGVESGAITFGPERTLFFIAGGLNDGRLKTEETTKNLSELVRRLCAVGARHILIAVLPEQIPGFDRVAKRLNPALRALPEALNHELSDAKVRTSRWGEYFDAVMLDPSGYGILNTTDACAGRAIFDEDTTPRGDPATYYFYHASHPSTAVHRHVGHMLAQEFQAVASPGAKIEATAASPRSEKTSEESDTASLYGEGSE